MVGETQKMFLVLKLFSLMGKIDSPQRSQNEDLHSDFALLKKLVCIVYHSNNSMTLPKLRWELFTKKSREREMLPPTLVSIFPYLMRVNFISPRDKSYTGLWKAPPSLSQSNKMVVNFVKKSIHDRSASTCQLPNQ